MTLSTLGIGPPDHTLIANRWDLHLTFQTKSVIGLILGQHELRIVVLGTSRPRSEGTNVAIDSFTVLP